MRIAALHSPVVALGSGVVVLASNAALDVLTRSAVGDWVALIYFALYGLYCLQNFAGCGEYHCLITGPGFLAAAALMALRIFAIWDHGFGPPYLVFFAAAVAGHAWEAARARRTGRRYRAGGEP